MLAMSSASISSGHPSCNRQRYMDYHAAITALPPSLRTFADAAHAILSLLF